MENVWDSGHSLSVTPQNAAFLRRVDHDGDGVMTRAELTAAESDPANASRLANEARSLTARDRSVLSGLRRGSVLQIPLTYEGWSVGDRPGELPWLNVRQALATSMADHLASPGLVGQERPNAMQNGDCGPACALYMHERRLKFHTGSVPLLTQAQADTQIAQAGAMVQRGAFGITAHEMAVVMSRSFANAGQVHYRFGVHAVPSSAGLVGAISKGLAADPGGVMVPVLSRYDARDTTGSTHWIVVTGLDPARGTATIYDPAGPDGANHEGQLPIRELQTAAYANDLPSGESAIELVWGQPEADTAAKGTLPIGLGIGEAVTITATAGVFGTVARAERHATDILTKPGASVVVGEGNSHAVYRVSGVDGSKTAIQDLDLDVERVLWHDGASVHHLLPHQR